ncbi:MAG: phosphate propanoyltransferase [Erysipelotrichaceae bacterium]|nr:phosphate propanoyltransferase [Erysipelotrichaceae bacterium]
MSEKILVETSARHIHLTQETVEKLFGEGYQLTVKKMLSQPGQFATNEKLTIVGPKGELKASVLGPVRKANQVELSLTDARTIGVKALVRESGDIEGTEGCKLVGPCGEVTIENGVIAAKRHIHFHSSDAEKFGVTNGQIVSVKVESKDRSLVFGDVVCRVSDKFSLAMHIDTDESNAAGGPTEGTIVK